MRTIMLALAITAVVAASASAQSTPQWKLYVDGELGFPSTPDRFTDGYDAVTFGGGVGLGYVLNRRITLTGSFHYLFAPLDEDGYRQSAKTSALVDGGGRNILYGSIGAVVYVLPEGSLRPYVLGGAGVYSLIQNDLTLTTGSTRTTNQFDADGAFGLNGGVGVEYAVGDAVGIYVEGQYLVGFTENDATGHVPVRGGVTFSFGG